MSVCADQPDLGMLTQNGFRVVLKRAPQLTFNCQMANIPGFSVPPTVYANPMINIPMHGDHMQYDLFSMQFIVDEHFTNYQEIWSWMRGYSKPNDYSEYADLKEAGKTQGFGLRSDISLFPMNSSKNVIGEILIKDAFPISMSPVVFDVRPTNVVYVTSQATFQFTSFDINL